MENQRKSFTQIILKNSVWNFVTAFIDKVGALIFLIIISRFLMPEGFGLYSLVLAIAFIFSTFADLGMNSALIMYVSDSIGKNKKSLAAAYYRFILKTKFIFTLSASLIIIFLSYPISHLIFKNPQMFFPLLVSGFYIFVLSFESLYTSLFFAINQVKYISIKELLSHILKIIFSLIALFLLASSYHVTGIFVSLMLASLLTILFIVHYLKKISPFIFSEKKYEPIDKIRVLKFLSYLSLLSVSAAFFSYVDLIMIGMFISDPKYAGFYSAASKLVFSVAGIFSFANILLPIFTQIKKNRLKDAFNKVFKYTMMLAVPVAFGLAVLGRYFIRLIFGYDYLPASYPLGILALLLIPGIVFGLFMSMLSAKEKLKKLTHLFIFINVLNIVLNYIFINWFLRYSLLWATVGAAISTVICWYIYFAGALFIMHRCLKIEIKISHLIKPIIASFVMALSIYYASLLFKDITLASGILLVFLGIAVYLVVLCLIKGISWKDITDLKISK